MYGKRRSEPHCNIEIPREVLGRPLSAFHQAVNVSIDKVELHHLQLWVSFKIDDIAFVDGDVVRCEDARFGRSRS